MTLKIFQTLIFRNLEGSPASVCFLRFRFWSQPLTSDPRFFKNDISKNYYLPWTWASNSEKWYQQKLITFLEHEPQIQFWMIIELFCGWYDQYSTKTMWNRLRGQQVSNTFSELLFGYHLTLVKIPNSRSKDDAQTKKHLKLFDKNKTKRCTWGAMIEQFQQTPKYVEACNYKGERMDKISDTSKSRTIAQNFLSKIS